MTLAVQQPQASTPSKVDFVSDVSPACPACGKSKDVWQNFPWFQKWTAEKGIPLWTKCGGCIESYCSSGCLKKFSETHGTTCQNRTDLIGSCNWAERACKIFHSTYSTNPKDESEVITPARLKEQLQSSFFLFVFDSKGNLVEYRPYYRFAKESSPKEYCVPLSREVKVHLAALSACIHFTNFNAIETNCNDVICIVMVREDPEIKDKDIFIGTFRLHPTFNP